MNRQSGATLLEVLVALALFCTTTLGMVRLQWQGLSDHQRAYRQLQANLLAEDLAERLLADPGGSRAGRYLYPPTAGSCTQAPQEGSSPGLPQWFDLLDCQLPGARASIQRHGESLEILVEDDGWQLLRRLHP